MIKHPTKLFQLGLNQVLRQSIVYWPKEKRAVFDKTSYNPNWVRSLGSQSFSTEIQSKAQTGRVGRPQRCLASGDSRAHSAHGKGLA
jgi:hypothetical protein